MVNTFQHTVKLRHDCYFHFETSFRQKNKINWFAGETVGQQISVMDKAKGRSHSNRGSVHVHCGWSISSVPGGSYWHLDTPGEICSSQGRWTIWMPSQYRAKNEPFPHAECCGWVFFTVFPFVSPLFPERPQLCVFAVFLHLLFCFFFDSLVLLSEFSWNGVKIKDGFYKEEKKANMYRFLKNKRVTTAKSFFSIT